MNIIKVNIRLSLFINRNLVRSKYKFVISIFPDFVYLFESILLSIEITIDLE